MTPTQLHEIHSAVTDPGIQNYILYMNGQVHSTTESADNRVYHLPYKDTKEVLPLILKKHEGKVIVMDFWATWCGPCIEAFNQVKEVKAKYNDQEDVVYIYVTTESSNYKQWKSYTEHLTGEHYYLNYDQDEIISKEYNIQYLPSYLIFNDTLIKWIEDSL